MNEFLTKLIERLGIDPKNTNFVPLFLLAFGIIVTRQKITDDEAIRLILNKAANNLADAGEAWGKLSRDERNLFVAETMQTNFATMAAFLDHRAPLSASKLEAAGHRSNRG